jgi:hypothetical protein
MELAQIPIRQLLSTDLNFNSFHIKLFRMHQWSYLPLEKCVDHPLAVVEIRVAFSGALSKIFSDAQSV